jgi:hypothetical protein
MKFDSLVVLDYCPTVIGIELLVVHAKAGWYVIAASEGDDPEFPPIGPFPTPEAAMVHIQLSKDRTS